jgi:hypothetical protein
MKLPLVLSHSPCMPVCVCLCLRQRDCRPSFFAAPSSYSPYSISILFPKRPNHAALPTIPLRHGLCLRAYYKESLSFPACLPCPCIACQSDNQNQIPPRQILVSRLSSSSNLTRSLLAVRDADCIDKVMTEVTRSSYGAKTFFSRTCPHHHRRQPFTPHPSNPPA